MDPISDKFLWYLLDHKSPNMAEWTWTCKVLPLRGEKPPKLSRSWEQYCGVLAGNDAYYRDVVRSVLHCIIRSIVGETFTFQQSEPSQTTSQLPDRERVMVGGG